MRTFWNIISFLAVVNLLAAVLVGAWLWQSGRLSRERAQDIRTMLSSTVADAEAQALRLASEAEAARLQQELEQVRKHPPADSATQIMHIALVHRETEQAKQRLEDERRVLGAELEKAAQAMESRSQEWQQADEQSQARRALDAHTQGEAQFLRAVKHLEQIPAKQAKGILRMLVTENNVDQAVAYLDSMNPRAAAKVLREFKSEEEIALATELLERIRTRGITIPAKAPGAAQSADPSTDGHTARDQSEPTAGSERD